MASYAYLCKKAGLPAPGTISAAAAELGRKGGAARREALTPQRRVEIAVAGAKARWGTRTPNRRNFKPETEELFLRMFAQVGPFEDAHFSTIYELALDLFYHVYGKMPSDIPRFQELRSITSSGGSVPLFQTNKFQRSSRQGSVFLANLHHAFAKTDGSYAFPNSLEGDLLKQAKKELEALNQTA